MKFILYTSKYIKRYPLLAAGIFIFVLLGSIFEGAGFGMLIPFMQSMTHASSNLLDRIPLLRDYGLPLFHADKEGRIAFIICAVFIFIVCKNIFNYLAAIRIFKLKLTATKDLGTSLVSRLLEFDIKYFDNAKTGYIINTL